MKGLSRSLMVVVAAVGGSAVPAAAQLGTNTTVVLERQVTNGVRLQVLQESVTLVSEEDLAKHRPKEVVWTNYIDGKPTVVVAGRVLSIPVREDRFYVAYIDGNRTNVNRTRYLKKVLFPLQSPWARFFDVLDEPPRTFYLHEDYPLTVADEEDAELVVTVVEEDPTDGREKVKIREFVLWSPTNRAEMVKSARLLESPRKGSVGVEMIIGPVGGWVSSATYTQRLWFRPYRWYPPLKPPPAKGDSRR